LIRISPAGALVLCCWGFCFAAALSIEDVFEGLAPERVGSELSAVLQRVELACHWDRTDAQLYRCVPAHGARWTLGQVRLSAVEALFSEQRLAQVTVYFPEQHFSEILSLVSARFGEGQDWSLTLRSGMAGQFSDQIRLWETDRFVLVAQQYDRKIDRSSLIYGTARAMASLLQRIKSTPPGALRDL